MVNFFVLKKHWSLSVRDKDAIAILIGEECNKAETTAENLLRAPEACCIIQALTVLACCTRDPSLKTGDANEKFLYLRHPDSFKASLYQVINAMCQTFRVAYNSMDKIHLCLSGMPELMTDILEDMDDLTSTEAIDNIEYGISTLQRISNICVEQAKNANDECKNAINVIQELLECALATQGKSERRTAEAKHEFEQQQRLKKQQDDLIQELEKQYEEQRTIAREAMEDYKLRMTQSTAFNEVVGVMLLDNLNTLIHTIGKTTMNVTSAAGSIPIATADVIKELLLSNKTPVSKEELMAKAVVCKKISKISINNIF
uniref:Uncharacterized protein n=1 Tax=Panagrolaimus davidi TaxID=227884 RepID=A0A914QZD8_9BILA